MGKRQLTAEQWRVISYLYHPDQLSRRTSPSLATVIDKQAVTRDDVIEVVERGLVQARAGGEECTRGPLKRMPETAIRLRLTKAGIYHAHHDPQHLVMCALRAHDTLTVYTLLRGLAQSISFGELCAMADKALIQIFWTDTDTDVPIRDVRTCPSFVSAWQTPRGRTFVAYQ